jgi:hypothetical protein
MIRIVLIGISGIVLLGSGIYLGLRCLRRTGDDAQMEMLQITDITGVGDCQGDDIKLSATSEKFKLEIV